MNKDQLIKNVGILVRLRPISRSRGPLGDDLAGMDDEWLIQKVEEQGVSLSNIRTGHLALLGFDHIHSYISNPMDNAGGRKHGFLQLRVRMCLHGKQLEIELLPPGDWGQDYVPLRVDQNEHRAKIEFLTRKLQASHESSSSQRVYEDFEQLYFLLSRDDRLKKLLGNAQFMKRWRELAPAFPKTDVSVSNEARTRELTVLLEKITWE